MSILADAGTLSTFIASIFVAAGSDDDEARQIAEHLVGANLTGHDSHGVGMVPTYLQHRREGLVHPNRRPERVGGVDPFAVFDARMGYGQPAVNAVMVQAADIARRCGVALVTLRNAQHVGRIGAYGESLSAKGLLSMHFVNVARGVPTVAPYRGTDARVMTNPICIAIPGPTPVLLDFATSSIAMGKTRVAFNKGELLPPGLVIDHDGRPSRDPGVLWRDPLGALLPFGEHKGWGLACVAELLGGVLAGGPSCSETPGQSLGLVNGMFSIVVEPQRLTDLDAFHERVARVAAYVKASPPAEPGLPVLVPGEPERESSRARERDGIPIDDRTWQQICEGAAGLGLPSPAFPVIAD